jgi:hypothetical protein
MVIDPVEADVALPLEILTSPPRPSVLAIEMAEPSTVA